jgi:ribosome-binding factor A
MRSRSYKGAASLGLSVAHTQGHSMAERMRRVNEALREVVSQELGSLKDPGLGFVTVTEVRASPDLAHATVYVSVLGSERRRERSLAALERAHGVLQQEVNRQLHLKRTPRLVFEYDRTAERAARLSQLLDELDHDRRDQDDREGDREP